MFFFFILHQFWCQFFLQELWWAMYDNLADHHFLHPDDHPWSHHIDSQYNHQHHDDNTGHRDMVGKNVEKEFQLVLVLVGIWARTSTSETFEKKITVSISKGSTERSETAELFPHFFNLWFLLVSKKVGRFSVLAQTSSTSSKASRHRGMQDFDAVVGLLTLDVLNCPALQSVEGGCVFRFPDVVFDFWWDFSSKFFRAKRLGIEHRYNCRGVENQRESAGRSWGNPWKPRWMWLQQRWICGVAVDWVTHWTGALGQDSTLWLLHVVTLGLNSSFSVLVFHANRCADHECVISKSSNHGTWANMWVPAVGRRLQKVGAEMRYTIATRWSRVRGSWVSRVAGIQPVMDRHFHRFPKRSWNEFFLDFPEFLEFQETKNNKNTTKKGKFYQGIPHAFGLRRQRSLWPTLWHRDWGKKPSKAWHKNCRWWHLVVDSCWRCIFHNLCEHLNIILKIT